MKLSRLSVVWRKESREQSNDTTSLHQFNFTSRRISPTLTTALLPVLLSQTSPLAAQGASEQAAVEEIVITGSNVIRDGYSSPTPTSVLTRDNIDTFAGTNIGDYLQQLPSFAGNQTPINTRRSTSAGGAGISSLNLRNLGTSRTLVLLDGQRVVASQPTGQIDINPFPQQLIQRVDVVTGGASAVYGSDAMSGVVNFVLDRHFTGSKFDVQGGMTDNGENKSQKVTASTGFAFADDRAHLLLSGEHSVVDGIPDCQYSYCKEGWNMISNPDYTPTNGLPERIIVDRSAPNNITPGGIITAGPLKGIAFGPGGVPYQYDYGTLVTSTYSQGGEWEANSVHKYTSVAPYAKRRNVFVRASYELTDNMEVFAQYSKGINDSFVTSSVRFNPGNLRVQQDNAFIPASVREQMIALDISTLTMGSYNLDVGLISSKNHIDLSRSVIGVDGSFDLFDTDWTYSAYFQYGRSINTKQFYDTWKDNYNRAIDAVYLPGTDTIVCRSTLTNPDDGCIPWNLFGTGVNTAEARAYVSGWSYAKENNYQKAYAVRVNGNPFEVPAGAVSLAFGLEHRIEDGNGVESDFNARNQSWFGNQSPIFGKYDVTEGFIETVVPLFSTLPTELNAAVRETDYSTSGRVTTWKVGMNFRPHSDILLRGTVSRDIRAPSRRELFATALFAGNQVIDRFRGDEISTANTATLGNLALRPEVADTTGFGIVYTSSWIDGFSISADYYDIDIKDAIGSVGAQDTMDRCYYNNETAFCNALIRNDAGQLTRINLQPVNYVVETNRGVDIESSYRFDAADLVSSWRGTFELRALATRYLEAATETGIGPVINNVGSNGNGPPTWKYSVTGTYRLDDLRVSLTGRGISSGVVDRSYIECSTGCPPSTVFRRTIDNNRMDGALYFDLSLGYELDSLFTMPASSELFLVVQNLTDEEPPIFARFGGNPTDPPSNPTYYDILGRELRFGIRTQF